MNRGCERGRVLYTFDNSMGKIVSFGLKTSKTDRKLTVLVCMAIGNWRDTGGGLSTTMVLPDLAHYGVNSSLWS